MLKKILDTICIKTKKEFSMLILSDYSLYRQKNNDDYIQLMNQLRKTIGVTIHPLVPVVELMRIFKRCKFYIHPSTYHETFGMVVVQAQACGCIPITVNHGSLSEIIEKGKSGEIITLTNIYNQTTFNEFTNLIITTFENDNKDLRISTEECVTTYRHTNIATKLLSIIDRGNQ